MTTLILIIDNINIDDININIDITTGDNNSNMINVIYLSFHCFEHLQHL